MYGQRLWERLHELIKKLNAIERSNSEAIGNFDEYQIPMESNGDNPCVRVDVYRGMLGGLIDRLYGEFFYDEQQPFSGPAPSNLEINTSMQQNQSQTVTLVIQEFTQLIDKKLPFYDKETPERSFLEKLKETVGQAKDASEIVSTVLSVAKTVGLGIDALGKMF